MFERFTDRARRVVVLAQEEARMLNHGYIGTEHILLGLIHEADGVAAKALESLSISLEVVRREVELIIGQGKEPPRGHIPFTPRAKKVLEFSLREALVLGHNYIGTEHIVLGLIREGEGVAAQVLVKLGGDLETVRQRVIDVLEQEPPGPSEGRRSPSLPEPPARTPEIARLDGEISAIRLEKEQAIDAQDFPRAAELRDREKELVQKRAEMMREAAGKQREEQGEPVSRSVGSRPRVMSVSSPPACPNCGASLAGNASFRLLEVLEQDGTGLRKVLFVYCRSCGITIDDEILPEGS
jgi:ATP-dependent Clp protease ATP-binding subunit ClpA